MRLTTKWRHGFRLAGAAVAFGFLLTLVPLPQFSFITASIASKAPLLGVSTASAEELSAVQAAADEPIGPERVTGADESVENFTAIGVKLRSSTDEPILIRTMDQHGSWGSWREARLETNEGPDLSSGEAEQGPVDAGTEPIWSGNAVGYEINLGSDAAIGAEVILVHDQQTRVTADATPLADAQTASMVGINSRAAWGARPSTNVSYGNTINLAVVHHSDSSNTYAPAEVPGILRSIQAYHMDGRGWADIGYNFVVDKYGGLWEGREGGVENSVIGAHAAGFNTDSVGVMAIGDYTAAQPTGEALETVSRVIGWKMALYGNNPTGWVTRVSGGSVSIPAGQVVTTPAVVGHQDVGATSCPGSFENQLSPIRARAQQWADHFKGFLGTKPVGFVDSIALQPQLGSGVLRVSGWAFDRDIRYPIYVDIVFNGSIRTRFLAFDSRPDVAAAWPGTQAEAGFDRLLLIGTGVHQVCVEAIGYGSGGNATLGCQQVIVK